MAFPIGRARSRKANLRVLLEDGVIESADGSGKEVFVVKAENEGDSEVVLTRVGMMLADGRKFFFPSSSIKSKLPRALEPGETEIFSQEIDTCLRLLRWEGYQGVLEFSALVVDDSLANHEGEILAFEIDQ